MGKSISLVEKELSDSTRREKHLKDRIKFWRSKAKDDRKMLKVVSTQYERVVREKQNQIDDFKANAVKLFALFLYEKYRKLRG